MKIKKYVMMLACAGALILSALSFQNSISYAGDDASNVSLTLNDFFTVAFANGESGSGSCSGSTCDDANGNRYTTLTTPNGVTCCGAAVPWPASRGNKKS